MLSLLSLPALHIPDLVASSDQCVPQLLLPACPAVVGRGQPGSALQHKEGFPTPIPLGHNAHRSFQPLAFLSSSSSCTHPSQVAIR